MLRIGIDVGGTFTDLVAIDEGGVATLAKVPSTPDDPSVGVVDGLATLAARLGLDRTALLARTERIVMARQSRPMRCSSSKAPAPAC